MELEYKILKEILSEQKKTNELLAEQNELIRKGGVKDGRTITKQSDVSKSEGTVRRQRGPNRNV